MQTKKLSSLPGLVGGDFALWHRTNECEAGFESSDSPPDYSPQRDWHGACTLWSSAAVSNAITWDWAGAVIRTWQMLLGTFNASPGSDQLFRFMRHRRTFFLFFFFFFTQHPLCFKALWGWPSPSPAKKHPPPVTLNWSAHMYVRTRTRTHAHTCSL